MVGVIVCGAGRLAHAAPPPPTKDGLEFFENKIRPVLVGKCYECHSQAKRKIKGKLRLDDYASMLKGGDSGKPSVVPGDPDKSLIMLALSYTDKDTDTHDALLMPPPKNGKPRKLADEVIEDFRQWIKMGAPYPQERSNSSQAAPVDRKKHWAFVPPREPDVPDVNLAAWVKGPIDNFVLAKLEEHNLHPSNPADKRTLIRRATFDLIGLPPTEQEVKAFEADDSPEAFEKVVDRLLASPQYGERWGRYWLDVARYADTKGYVFEEERRYPYSYTYRDWVIRALNQDLPYDQFLVDQIAADKLDLKDGNSPLAAEGFLTLGRRFLNQLPDIIDDRIDVVCRGTMALTVGCARCHDHKFDPISQKDYYSLYSVFNNSPESTDLPLIGKPQDTPGFERFTNEVAGKERALEEYQRTTLQSHLARLRSARQISAYLMASTQPIGAAPRGKPSDADAITPFMISRWRDFLDGNSAAVATVFGAWKLYATISTSKFSAKAEEVTRQVVSNQKLNPRVAALFEDSIPTSLGEVARRYGDLLAACDSDGARAYPDEEALRQALRADDSPTSVSFEQRARVFTVKEGQHERAMKREIEAFKATDPDAPPRAMTLHDAASRAPQNVFLRGNPGNPGPGIKPAFLTILSQPDAEPFTQGSGRLELAHDIASRDNPLTARVMVNRIWLHHFGKGLVRTPSDFGTRSDPPTHPELLDWLALRFMDNGWSVKKLHKLIMLSATYQQGSDADPATLKADPDNMLISHFNRQRLDWEATRDSLLFVSGGLELKMGGRAEDILETGRRSIYGFIDRQNLPGVFRAFDFATPDATSPQRFTTTVPQQALFLMNSPFAIREARGLTKRSEVAAVEDPPARIDALYRIIYQREPTPQEIAIGLQFLQTDAGSPKLTAWEQYAQVLLESNEFVFVD